MPYRRKGVATWTVAVPTPGGGWVKRATGFRERRDAIRVERMLADLGRRGRYATDLLGRVVDGTLVLRDLLAAHDANDLDGLRARLTDIDLEPLVEEWLTLSRGRVSHDTVQHYRHAVRNLIENGQPFPRSRFTVDVLEPWVMGYKGGRSTRRKCHAAMSQFAQFLVRRRVVPVNPMRSITPPPASPPRVEWRDVPELTRIADGQPEPYRTLSALLAGTGIEVSVAVQLKRRDVDSTRREIRAAGTKTHARDRIARVAQWAWPYVERHIAALHPDAPLFPPGVDRWAAREMHADACKALGIANYRQQDHRHSWAVRALRAGTPVELVSRHLGHANAVLVLKVYGRFMPTHEDRDKWERIAAMQDEAAAAVATRGSIRGSIQTGPTKGKAANRIPISGLRSSRGGTRTRDPGIMSAVL
jgi:integrase